MNILKSIGSFALGLSVLVAGWLVIILFINGTAYVTAFVIPYLMIATSYVMPICGVILLPLTAFKTTRTFAVIAIYASTFLFGALLWSFGFLVTYTYWGILGVIVGLFIAGVGVVPIAVIAAAFHSEWGIVFNLLLGAAIVFGARMWAMHQAEKIDREAEMELYASRIEGG